MHSFVRLEIDLTMTLTSLGLDLYLVVLPLDELEVDRVWPKLAFSNLPVEFQFLGSLFVYQGA